MTDQPLLAIDDLHVAFGSGNQTVHALRGISLEVRPGEKVGIVGESGCGKSVTGKAVLGLIDRPGRITSGAVRFRGDDLTDLGAEQLRTVRGGEIAMIFQDPLTSLNPVLTIRRQIDDVLRAHSALSRSMRHRRIVELLEAVGIPDVQRRLDEYPHEFSGGMRQRVMIAMALANEPRLLIADEPTTALDVTVQAQVLELLSEINSRLGTAILFISHDLRVVADICDRILVLYAGRIIESGSTYEVFDAPMHPYTRALFDAAPRPGYERASELRAIPGSPPILTHETGPCAFAPRCPSRFDRCSEDPTLVDVGNGRGLACWLPDREAAT